MTDSKPPEEWYERTRYQILLFAGGIALFGIVLGLILDRYIDPQTSTQKKDLVQALGLITAGVAGAVGIFLTWRGQKLAREVQEQNQKSTQAQLENAQEELRPTRQGQITERFTRAFEQLGHDHTEIRAGGIYALERIAKESPEDYWPVMEILTAYVRERAPWGSSAEMQPLSPDIQAILTVLGRRTRYFKGEEPGHNIDLRNTDLPRANLVNANLVMADLRGANLQGAKLSEANLSSAHLQGADLQRADFFEAILSETTFDGANVAGADLAEADFRGPFPPGQEHPFELTIGSSETKFRSDLNRPGWWSKEPAEQAQIILELLQQRDSKISSSQSRTDWQIRTDPNSHTLTVSEANP